MQPLLRVVPRRAFESIAYSAGLPPLRLPIRPSTCLQCRIRSRARGFADDSKPIIPASPASAPKDDLSQPAKDEPPAEELPSSEESRRLALTKRFSHIMDNLQGNIFLASQRINDLTGYSGIEALKQRIVKLEQRVQDAQEAVRSSRITYKTTVADRASTQREVTTLLARKDSWTPTDLERFTSLYRNDHSNEQAVQEAATRLADAEREAEHAATTLSSSILSRYHEEQIWSDKIRRMSTWGTWGLMGVNIFLFLVFQLGFEPWRRKRLVHGFEEKVREALELEKAKQASEHNEVETVPLDGLVAAGVQELEAESEAENTNTPEPAVDAVVACIEGDVPTEEVDPAISPEIADIQSPTLLAQLKKPETYQKAFQDLFSERLVSMRKQDVTLIALEGAATGAALAIAIGSLIVRHS